MTRIPMVVTVECDDPACTVGITVHNKDEGIGLIKLEEYLKQEGWTSVIDEKTGLKNDICPVCTTRRAVVEQTESESNA